MLVSIIIPCFNVESYIEECIQSAIKQTYIEKEIICIDNNSSDNTWNKLIELQKKYPIIKIDKELKAGAPAARNKGLKLSKGEWIQFLDADDLILPKKIEHQVNLIQNNSDISFIAASYIKRNIDLLDKNVDIQYGNPFIKLFNTKLGITSSNLFKKSVLDKIGNWNESYTSSQEAKLMFELLKINNNVIFDQVSNTIIRERESGQISQSNPTKKWFVYAKLREEILRYLQNKYPILYKKEKSHILNSFFDTLRILAKYDINQALKYFNEFFPSKFIPIASSATTSNYIIVYKFLGFKKTEIFISFIKNILVKLK